MRGALFAVFALLALVSCTDLADPITRPQFDETCDPEIAIIPCEEPNYDTVTPYVAQPTDVCAQISCDPVEGTVDTTVNIMVEDENGVFMGFGTADLTVPPSLLGVLGNAAIPVAGATYLLVKCTQKKNWERCAYGLLGVGAIISWAIALSPP